MLHHIYLARAVRIFELTRRKRFAKSSLCELVDGDPDPSPMDLIIGQYGIKPPSTQYSKKMITLACKRALKRAKEAGQL